jgi:hypothetical protein
MPFNGEKNELQCEALRQNHGLYTQCKMEKKVGNFCKSCAQLASKNEDGIPEYGTIDQRLAVDIFDYVDPKGRKPCAYTKIMKKNKITEEQVLEEAKRLGITINPKHFVEAEETKKGRPVIKPKEPKEPKGNKGRPKKINKVVQIEETEDLFASLVASACYSSADEKETTNNTQIETNNNIQIETTNNTNNTNNNTEIETNNNNTEIETNNTEKINKKAEKEAKLAAAKAEKEAKLAAAKAEKEAKLASEKAEKEAKLAAAKAEKEAKLASEKAEKEAKLAAAKAEKEAKKKTDKKQKKEPKQPKEEAKSESPKEEAKSESPKEEAKSEEPEETYKKCGEVNGKKYIRSQQTGIVYDFDRYTETEELMPVGKWNADKREIIFNNDDEDSELSDDEIDDE